MIKLILTLIIMFFFMIVSHHLGFKNGKKDISEKLQKAILNNKAVEVEGFIITQNKYNESEIWIDCNGWKKASIKKTGGL